jgi:NAD+ kinase
MKIKLLGKNLDDIRPLLRELGFEESDRGFELIVTHGGDGALLGAEREFPGVPKLPLRDAATARPCPAHDARRRLEKFLAERPEPVRLPKLSGSFEGHVIYGINDVFLHRALPTSALRYRVRIDGEPYGDEIVGDGVGLSSVHGSTAYYRSITHSIFRVGVGLSFSNSTEEVDHMVLDAASAVTIRVTRGPAVLVADNTPRGIDVAEGGVVTMRQTGEYAYIYDLAGFMCPACRMLRHHRAE